MAIVWLAPRTQFTPSDERYEVSVSPLRVTFTHEGTACPLEAGVPFAVVSDIMGWSASTAIRMARRYAHIGHAARRNAIDKLASATTFDSDGAQKWAQSLGSCAAHVQ